MFLNKWVLILFLTLGMLGASVSSWSANAILGTIDKEQSYDIYYGDGGDSGSFVVRNVKVLRIEEISGLDFLVFINDAGFNAKFKEGFVLFSTVKAIVPSNTFTVNVAERFKSY